MTPEKIKQIFEAAAAVESAPHGARGKRLAFEAARLGMSPRNLSRAIMDVQGRKRKLREDAGAEKKNTATKKWTLIACEYIKKIELAGETKRTLAMESAIAAAERDGRIPPGALKVETAKEIRRRMGVSVKKKHRRLMEKYANHSWQFDGSGSEYLYPIDKDADGNWLFAVRATKKHTWKNTRIPADGVTEEARREMLYYYAAVDGYSGVLFIEPVVAHGEDFDGSARFIQRAFEKKTSNPLIGLPEKLITDSGPLGKNRGEEMLRGLSVELEKSKPYNSKAKGKVERPWRTLWQRFELELLLDKDRIFTFAELKNMLENYLADYNGRPHSNPKFEKAPRERIYALSLAEREQRFFPEGADIFQFAPVTIHRVIDGTGSVRIENETYEIVDCPAAFIGKKALCLRYPDRVMVRNPQDLSWMSTRKFEPVIIGEHRKFKHDVNNELEERAAELKGRKISHRYEAALEKGSEVVVPIVRGREIEPELEESPALPTLCSVTAAVLLFAEESGYGLPDFPEDQQLMIRKICETNMSNPAAIIKIAREVGGIMHAEGLRVWRAQNGG